MYGVLDYRTAKLPKLYNIMITFTWTVTKLLIFLIGRLKVLK